MTKTTKKATPTKKDMFSSLSTRYPHVVAIAEIGKHGKPTRIQIRCTADGCSTKREIATQDAFQVERCEPCQREHAKAKRRKTPVEAAKPKSPKARKRRARRAKAA